jgi:predicted O-methyltransferase YrrM
MEHERMMGYIRSLISYDHGVLKTLEADAAVRDDIQPFIEPELAKLLGLLIRLTRAERILELGSGIGYSTIWLGMAARAVGGTVTAIDNHERTSAEARRHIAEAGLSDLIELRQGDVQQILPELVQQRQQYDLIFQDCGKSTYNEVYEDVYALLRPQGLLFTDDTLLQFDPQTRKGLGVHVDRYDRRLFADSRYYTTMLPAGQGVCLSLKQGSEG